MEQLSYFQKQLLLNNSVVPAVKVGRCFNGAERDKGTIVHLVPPLPEGSNGDWFDKSLCGAEPGRRGNGWSKVDKDVTCPKCLKKFNNQNFNS